MIRNIITPRADWQKKVESEGLIWHTVDDKPYWNESAYYSFTSDEITHFEFATLELYKMFLEAGERVARDPVLLNKFGIPEQWHQIIRDLWDQEPPALNMGRFDFAYDGYNVKLLEFNCDTPTSLLEAAVIQWSWKQDVFPRLDQFTSIHDKLVAKWQDIKPLISNPVHFTHFADTAGEDTVTTNYLRDTADTAGIDTIPIIIQDIGWDEDNKVFVDLDENPINTLFKLYPWEWLINEAFAPQMLDALSDGLIVIEPVWKMLWSNKAILTVLWDMYPNHPYLLETSFEDIGGDVVAKPLLSREGSNISIRKGDAIIAETQGDYGEEGYVYQRFFALPEVAPGTYPIIGSWIIDGDPAGIGIREDGLITGNTAQFVPHVIDG